MSILLHSKKENSNYRSDIPSYFYTAYDRGNIIKRTRNTFAPVNRNFSCEGRYIATGAFAWCRNNDKEPVVAGRVNNVRGVSHADCNIKPRGTSAMYRAQRDTHYVPTLNIYS